MFAALVLCLAVPAMATEKATKAVKRNRLIEFGLAGEFVQVTDAKNTWELESHLYFPVTKSGFIVIGPEIVASEDDSLNRLGVGADWNFLGQRPFSPFVGASVDWFQHSLEDADRNVALVRAGFKIPVGTGAAIRLAAEDVVAGRGKEDTDLIVSAGIIAKF